LQALSTTRASTGGLSHPAESKGRSYILTAFYISTAGYNLEYNILKSVKKPRRSEPRSNAQMALFADLKRNA